MSRKEQTARREAFLSAAKSQLGYKPGAFNTSEYGKAYAQDGTAWDGHFVRWCGDKADLDLDAASAPAAFLRANRGVLNMAPRLGDISVATDGGVLRLGVVTDIKWWYSRDKVQTIEGMSPDVRYRLRFSTDLIGFIRPDFNGRVPLDTTPAFPPIQFSALMKGDKVSVIQVQRALEKAVGLSKYTSGVLDSQTVSALKAYQEEMGLPKPTGELTVDSLRHLGYATRRYTLKH